MFPLQLSTYKDREGTGVSVSGPRKIVQLAVTAIENVRNIGGSGAAMLRIAAGLLEKIDSRFFDDLSRDLRFHVESKFGVRITPSLHRHTTTVTLTEDKVRVDDTNLVQALSVAQDILIYYFPDVCGFFYIRPRHAKEAICGQNNHFLTNMQSLSTSMTMDWESLKLWICASNRVLADKVFDRSALAQHPTRDNLAYAG